jgi:hypothetical protein
MPIVFAWWKGSGARQQKIMAQNLHIFDGQRRKTCYLRGCASLLDETGAGKLVGSRQVSRAMRRRSDKKRPISHLLFIFFTVF